VQPNDILAGNIGSEYRSGAKRYTPETALTFPYFLNESILGIRDENVRLPHAAACTDACVGSNIVFGALKSDLRLHHGLCLVRNS
jgi:hypothetical protein